MAKNLFALVVFVAVAANAEVVAIKNVRVFDGARVIPTATVTVENGVITGVGAVNVPEGATVVDGKGKTLLPGFIDAHAHVFPDSLKRALRFGVTTELDMFTSLQVMKAGKSPATDRADLMSAGTLVTVAGGHGSEYFPIPTFAPGSDPQAFIDARIAEGSDYIKLVYDSGSSFGLKWNTLTKDDLTALIAAAHRRGKLALVHISSQAGAREALEAGADGLVHLFGSQKPDADFGKFVKTKKAFVIPTLTVVESASGVASGASLVADARLQPFLSAGETETLKASFPARPNSSLELSNAYEAVKQLRAAGVRILAGTDAGNPGTAHGASMHRELELLVNAGLTPTEALTAATATPAAAFGLKDKGRIAKGMKADLLLVNGDPTTDIMATRDIATVWKSGVALVRQPEPKQSGATAERVAADKLASGVVSNFESGEATSEFGFGWQISTDAMAGGKSTAEMRVIDGGAAGSARALRVDAKTIEGAMFPWAGAMVFFGSRPMAGVDLSSKAGLTFYARGNTEIRLMAFATSTGRMPRITSVRAGENWTELTVPWSAFNMDGKDIQAVLFSGPAAGPVTFDIDEVRVK